MLTLLTTVLLTVSSPAPEFSAAPMVAVEGRAASLGVSTRLAEIDQQVAELKAMPVGLRVLQVAGFIAVAAPLTFGVGMGIFLTGAVIAYAGVVGVLFSPFVFAFGLVYGLPVWGWVIAGVGVAAIAVSAVSYAAVLKERAAELDTLSAERRAILTSQDPQTAPAGQTVLTF
jgi:hypothetical protein